VAPRGKEGGGSNGVSTKTKLLLCELPFGRWTSRDEEGKKASSYNARPVLLLKQPNRAHIRVSVKKCGRGTSENGKKLTTFRTSRRKPKALTTIIV